MFYFTVLINYGDLLCYTIFVICTGSHVTVYVLQTFDIHVILDVHRN